MLCQAAPRCVDAQVLWNMSRRSRHQQHAPQETTTRPKHSNTHQNKRNFVCICLLWLISLRCCKLWSRQRWIPVIPVWIPGLLLLFLLLVTPPESRRKWRIGWGSCWNGGSLWEMRRLCITPNGSAMLMLWHIRPRRFLPMLMISNPSSPPPLIRKISLTKALKRSAIPCFSSLSDAEAGMLWIRVFFFLVDFTFLWFEVHYQESSNRGRIVLDSSMRDYYYYYFSSLVSSDGVFRVRIRFLGLQDVCQINRVIRVSVESYPALLFWRDIEQGHIIWIDVVYV